MTRHDICLLCLQKSAVISVVFVSACNMVRGSACLQQVTLHNMTKRICQDSDRSAPDTGGAGLTGGPTSWPASLVSAAACCWTRTSAALARWRRFCRSGLSSKFLQPIHRQRREHGILACNRQFTVMSMILQPNRTINTLRLATWWLARASDSCLMCDYVCVINFHYYYYYYYITQSRFKNWVE